MENISLVDVFAGLLVLVLILALIVAFRPRRQDISDSIFHSAIVASGHRDRPYRHRRPNPNRRTAAISSTPVDDDEDTVPVENIVAVGVAVGQVIGHAVEAIRSNDEEADGADQQPKGDGQCRTPQVSTVAPPQGGEVEPDEEVKAGGACATAEETDEEPAAASVDVDPSIE